MNKIVTDLDIQALVDEELDREQAKHVWRFIEHNDHARKRYQDLVRQRESLKAWWKAKKIH